VATSPKASPITSRGNAQSIQMLAKNNGALNAGAAPFLLSSKGMISPPISPRNCNVGAGLPLSAQMNQMALPHPQSFAFPPPPLPQHALHAHTNWLPVPAAPVHQQQQAQQYVEPHSPFHGHGGAVPMQQFGGQMNQMMPMQQFGGGNGMAMQHRASPLFTPTQSPQFRPFSH